LHLPARGLTRGALRPGQALGFVAFVAILFLYLGAPLQIRLGESGMLAAEWLLLFVPALLFVYGGGFDFRRTLSLVRPTRRGVLGALLLIAGATPAAWFVGWLQTFFLPIPWEILEGLEDLVTADSAGRLIWLLLLLAVTPALCEEVVFRGVLLAGTRSLDPWRFILLNGALFGAFHLSSQTVIRFLPTASLGIVIAWAVWRTASIWIGVLMHLVNNASIVVLASVPSSRELLSDPEAPPPLWLVPFATIALTLGVRALRAEGTDPTYPARNENER
jgi:sodium transport system permease protein